MYYQSQIVEEDDGKDKINEEVPDNGDNEEVNKPCEEALKESKNDLLNKIRTINELQDRRKRDENDIHDLREIINDKEKNIKENEKKLKEIQTELEKNKKTIEAIKDKDNEEIIKKNEELNKKNIELKDENLQLKDQLQRIKNDKNNVSKETEDKYEKKIKELEEDVIRLEKNGKRDCSSIQRLLDKERQTNLELARELDNRAS